MYETVVYEGILKRMLDRVPSGFDKREGSLLYTVLAPAAAEMQLMYIELDTVLRETFADTASREFLVRRAAERGMAPGAATRAVLRAVAVPDTVDIPVGERFRLGAYNYVVTECLGDGVYHVACETAGRCGNHQSGYLIPVLNVPGLQTMEMTDLLIPGTDDEDTEAFRAAYFASFDDQGFGGNRKDYMDKTNSIDGVGATKPTRAWNGAGTVRLTILDADFSRASDVLVREVQDVIDPLQDGGGDGLAPINHVVTVDTAAEILVNVRCRIVFDNGYDYSALQERIDQAVEAYLHELRTVWQSQVLVVRISQIEARLLAVQGVADVSSTVLNDKTENLILSEYEIPVLGGVAVD